MGGFLGIGGSSAKTDRGNQLAATQGAWNIFNYGLPAGQAAESSGTSKLNQAFSGLGVPAATFDKLLTAGRTDTAQSSAPAVNAVVNQQDAATRQEATQGTGRTGGTAEFNRGAAAKTAGTADTILNQAQQANKTAGAEGLTKIAGVEGGLAGTQLNDALSLLGLGSNADANILSNATQSRQVSLQQQQASGQALAQALMLAAMA